MSRPKTPIPVGINLTQKLEDIAKAGRVSIATAMRWKNEAGIPLQFTPCSNERVTVTENNATVTANNASVTQRNAPATPASGLVLVSSGEHAVIAHVSIAIEENPCTDSGAGV